MFELIIYGKITPRKGQTNVEDMAEENCIKREDCFHLKNGDIVFDVFGVKLAG